LLLIYLPGWVRPDIGRAAYDVLAEGKMIFPGRNNRGLSTGKVGGRASQNHVKLDGSISRSNYNSTPPQSGIMGYFDRATRWPYHRATSFLRDYPQGWAALQPYIQVVDRAFAEGHPERYAVQRAIADATAQDFVINGTAFTTVTVNHDWQTACHRDAGDLREGFGVITCLRAGAYTGGHLCIPRYRVAVDLQSCDVLLFNVHEVHGNLPIRGKKGGFKRVSCVFYYREKMLLGGDAAYEMARAKRCRELGCIYSPDEVEKGKALKAEILERFV
jgi:hypothetical protein